MDQISQDNAYAPPTATTGGTTPITGTGWVKFWGILTLIGGASMCMTIIMLPLGIPYVLAGIAAMKGADETNSFNASRDPETADRALREFVKHFKMVGIVTLVILVVYLLLLFGIFAAAAFGIMSEGDV